jgi:site-specific recombinase XerD
MGHSNVSTTQKYLFVDEAEMQNAVLGLSKAFAQPCEKAFAG